MQYVPSLGEFGRFVISCLEDGKQRCCCKNGDNSSETNAFIAIKEIYFFVTQVCGFQF